MAITRMHADGLHQTSGYAHVTVVDNGSLAFVAGQCPLDGNAQLVGRGDIVAQVDQVVVNARQALAAAGALPEDVVRSVVYVVSDDSKVLSAVWDRFRTSVIGPAFTTASTLLGVAALAYEGQLVEVDLTAALREESAPIVDVLHSED